ncbi:MAG: hypothetical protein KGS09_05330 [Nitrospirae bacterium]|nr:hypothetical protein [Nitrospirota bacterium]MBU6479948.1 hypothetical protein [Nitrospirota bacterium]MDE3039051.1 hypothetical protein [Nitrospirota bacterium]MDE3219805.1 hypothetical protein [Nitrospirota bacterium]
MRTFRFAIVVLALFSVGCAALSGSQEQYFVCSYDIVWDASLETMKGQSVATYDKDKGVIESSWLDVPPIEERSYGIFGRDGFGNKERARMTVSVKRLNDVASVSVLETRQRWHARGGATSQATKWWPVEPSEDATNDIVVRITAKLKEKGCVPA